MAVWDTFLTETDRQVYEASGYGARGGLGSRPAVLVVDVNYAFTGDAKLPIVESIATWRNSCGATGWAAIEPIQRLLSSARVNRIPVFYSTGINSRPDGFDRGAWSNKNSRSGEDLTPAAAQLAHGNDIVKDIAPQPHEILIRKLKPSPFNGTPLAGFLVDLGVDSLIICGTTTSGCVRAAVIDAFSLNYKIAIVEECTFDRFESSHAINLFDMQAKYCDLVGLGEATEYLDGIGPGCYDSKIAFPRSTVGSV